MAMTDVCIYRASFKAVWRCASHRTPGARGHEQVAKERTPLLRWFTRDALGMLGTTWRLFPPALGRASVFRRGDGVLSPCPRAGCPGYQWTSRMLVLRGSIATRYEVRSNELENSFYGRRKRVLRGRPDLDRRAVRGLLSRFRVPYGKSFFTYWGWYL